MKYPHTASTLPFTLELTPGEYAWCACGLSREQPFCDGSHAGTGFSPVRFTVGPRDGVTWLCGCKHTRRPPYCDGRHNRLGKKKGA